MTTDEARERAAEAYDDGYRFQLRGRLTDAIARYRESIKLFPTAEAHAHLAWSIAAQGRFKEAIEECKRAIELDPEYGNPYNDIGYYLIEMGQHGRAIPWLRKALKAQRYDHFAYPHFNLGRVWEHLGTWHEALKEYRAALEISPDFEEARVACRRLAANLN